MPELPEVETIKSQLGKFLIGHEIVSIDVKNRKTFQGDENKIIGSEIIGTRRFAKVVAIDFENGYSLLAHVKLTGQFIYRGPKLKKPKALSKKVIGGIPGPHTLVVFNLNKGGVLYYNDVRRFGWIKIIETKEVLDEPFVKKLGPEPDVTGNTSVKSLTIEMFKEILLKSKRPVKLILMDQEKMGGVGNIYANDALWLAEINPRRLGSSLTKKEAERLFQSVSEVLLSGLKYGGASELAFVTPDGNEGEYQDHTLVYGREKKLCVRCKKTRIAKFFLGGRGTYFCPVCQKT